MPSNNISRILHSAWYFVVLNPYGPRGDAGSFRPTRVSYDEKSGRWIVECEFRREGEPVKARVVISDSGEVIGYEELQRGGA